MPGYLANPYPYIEDADVFVLSSGWEGLPTVVIEALALGTQVVSTNCPTGPSEILDHGRYGRLVPVADPEALATTILTTFNHPLPTDLLRTRAQDFTVDQAVNNYYQLLMEQL